MQSHRNDTCNPLNKLQKKQPDLLLSDLGENEKMKESGFIIPQDIPCHSWIKRGLDYEPNRYGIKPGRHWDGVDRSNGESCNSIFLYWLRTDYFSFVWSETSIRWYKTCNIHIFFTLRCRIREAIVQEDEWETGYWARSLSVVCIRYVKIGINVWGWFYIDRQLVCSTFYLDK